MKKINRIFAAVTAITLLFCLTACGGETAPETTAASTTEPVNICEINGHAWADATCDVAKTCSVCGETEGEALGHTWTEANYQQPKTCSVCNATEGEPLVSYFEASGLEARLLDMAGSYQLPLVCYQDESKTTVTEVIPKDYKSIVSDESHEALDGYEWKVFSFVIHIHDENAWNYGFLGFNYLWCDKYEKEVDDGEPTAEGLFTTGIACPILWNGVEYEDGWIRIEEANDGWQKDEGSDIGYFDINVTVSARVPVGYDGFILGLEQTKWEWPEGTALHEVITEAGLLFNLK